MLDKGQNLIKYIEHMLILKIIRLLAVLTIMFIIQSCARWEPVIDPRGSKDPEEVTRDILECRELTKNIGPSVFKCKENIFKQELCERPMRKCLINRGHSVLN